jgi:hypothetical protein
MPPNPKNAITFVTSGGDDLFPTVRSNDSGIDISLIVASFAQHLTFVEGFVLAHVGFSINENFAADALWCFFRLYGHEPHERSEFVHIISNRASNDF